MLDIDHLPKHLTSQDISMEFKVSVIIPVCNTEKYLEQCLDSVLAQSLENVEIICVDDASEDSSLEILMRYREQYPDRIRVICHDTNMTASQCRKDGVLASTGKYVMFLDSDDFLDEDACHFACKAIEERNVDVLQYGTVIMNCANLPDSRIASNDRALKPYLEKNIEGDLLEACFLEKKFSVNLWNKIFVGDLARKAFAEVEDGIFPKANDLYALFFLLAYANSYSAIEMPLYYYCFGRGMTGRNVMSLKNFQLHCQGSRVVHALRRFAESAEEEERARYTRIVDQIQKNLTNEQCGRCIGNLEPSERKAGFNYMASLWEGGEAYILDFIASEYYYKRTEMAAFLQGCLDMEWRPRKIRTVAFYYSSVFNGGAQRVVAQLCNLFARQMENGEPRYRVVLVTNEEPLEGEYEISPNVIREIIPSQKKVLTEGYAPRAAAWRSIIERHQIDVVLNSQWVEPATFWDLQVIKSHPRHPAYVYHSHSTCGMIYRMESMPQEMQVFYAMADGVVTLSNCDRKYWQTINKNTHYIMNPCAISPEETIGHKARFGGKNILWLGRIAYEKRPMEMLRIMRYVVEEIPDAKCHIVGEGSQELSKKLSDAIEEEGLQENVILEGFHEDVGKYYEEASVYMVTSLYEGFLLTLYESAAFGVPTVIYDRLPWLEYYRVMNGWTNIPDLDAEKAAKEIVHLLKDEEYWQKKSNELIDSFQQYSTSDIMGDWNNFLETLESSELPLNAGDPDLEIIFRQIADFHYQCVDKVKKSLNAKLKKAYAEKSEINAKLQKTYKEKSEINAKLQKTYKEKSEINAELQKTYEEKSEINAKLKLTYAEKSDISAKLKKTYVEKAERGMEIKRLTKENEELRAQLEDLLKPSVRPRSDLD